jgi:hypothetical protein
VALGSGTATWSRHTKILLCTTEPYCCAVVKAVKATTEGLLPSSSSFDITAARCGGTFEATKARQTMLVHAFIKPPALLSFLMAVQVPVIAVVYTTICIYILVVVYKQTSAKASRFSIKAAAQLRVEWWCRGH